MPVGQTPVGEARDYRPEHWARAGLPESVISRMPGPPPDTTLERTQRTHPVSRETLKYLIPPGIEPWPLGWKIGRDSTDHAMALEHMDNMT